MNSPLIEAVDALSDLSVLSFEEVFDLSEEPLSFEEAVDFSEEDVLLWELSEELAELLWLELVEELSLDSSEESISRSSSIFGKAVTS